MTTTIDFTEFTGKRVILSIPDDEGTLTEQEVTIQSVNPTVLLVKPKGQIQFEMIDVDKVQDIQLAPTATKKVKAKRINPISLGTARQHLLDRHGAKVAEMNELTEDQAFAAHEAIDHKADDLGHYHEIKAEKSDDGDEDNDDESSE